MQKYKEGICSMCGNTALIVRTGKMVGICCFKKYERERVKKKNGGKMPTRIKPKKGKTGELDLFIKIWKERSHQCVSCGKKIYIFSVSNFSHTIAKKKRDDLRLKEENIEIECDKCHHIWDNGTIQEKLGLFSFNRKMEYIKKVDSKYYYRIMHKVEEWQSKQNDSNPLNF